MKKKILMAMLCSIAMVCSALAQEVKVTQVKKNGCCVTTMKSKKCNMSTMTTGNSDNTVIGGADGETSMVIVNGKGDVKPLVVVNGKMYTKDINSIAPDQIESINVLKGQSATDKYGAKAKDGVVEITLKKQLDAAKGANGVAEITTK